MRVLRAYNYLNERKIAISAEEELLKKIERNIDEPAEEPVNVDCLITLESCGDSIIVKDKSFPYDSARINNDLSFTGYDYLRYGTLVRTVWQKARTDFLVRSFVKEDEDAFSKCFKKYYLEEASEGRVLLHASTVESEKGGILIPGLCRSGKTTLTICLAERLGCTLVSDGDSIVNSKDEGLISSYLPRAIYARFSAIILSPGLSGLIENYRESEATQYFDHDALDRIIAAKRFDVDAGINCSRKKFAELLRVKTKPQSKISTIIFPEYSSGHQLTMRSIGVQEAVQRLKANAFPKEVDLGVVRKQQDIQPPELELPEEWLNGIKLISISYSGAKALSKSLLEDLITT